MLGISVFKRTAIPRTPLHRYMSSKGATKRGQMLELDFIDPYVPPSRLPSLFAPNSGKLYWERTKKVLKATISIALVKWAIKKWKPKQFALEAQDLYVKMNELFQKYLILTRNDMEGLKKICTSGMIMKLKADQKQIAQIGSLRWKSHGQDTPPKLLHAAQAKAQMEQGEQKIAQATVQINLKQSVAIYKGNELKSGDLKYIESPIEYIVLEKWLDKPDSSWLIKGKIQKS